MSPETDLIVLPSEDEMRAAMNAARWPQGNPRYAMRRPDWTYWRFADRIELVNAVLLSLDLDPRTIPMAPHTGAIKLGLFSQLVAIVKARNAHRVVERGSIVLSCLGISLPVHHGIDLTATVELTAFGDFAVKKGLEIPGEFPRTRAQLSAPGPTAPAPKWPWGAHETPLLRHLEEAAKKFWGEGYDRASAPTNARVIEWLVERDVPQRVAEVMAQLLRPDAIPAGPRAKRNTI